MQGSQLDAAASRLTRSVHQHLTGPEVTTLALDQLSFAVLVVEQRGRVVFANRVGNALLKGGHGIGLQAGRICMAPPEEDHALLQAVAAAVERGRRSILSLSGMDGEMQLTIGPLQGHGHTSGFAMIFVSAARLATSAIQAIREMFDLTGAESSIVAELLAGRTLNQAAA